MCNWERINYTCGHSELSRMPYSCTVYTRHIYGTCRFDESRVLVQAFSNEYCKECRRLYEFVNI